MHVKRDTNLWTTPHAKVSNDITFFSICHRKNKKKCIFDFEQKLASKVSLQNTTHFLLSKLWHFFDIFGDKMLRASDLAAKSQPKLRQASADFDFFRCQ